jgi:hypothetical protein
MKSTLSTLAGLALISQVSAATFVTSAPATGTAIGSTATYFQLTSPTTIEALGAYNSGSTGTLGNPLTVQLFALATGDTVVRETTISGSGDGQIGAFVYKNLLTPVTLAVGLYAIGVSGFSVAAPYNDVTAATFDGSVGIVVGTSGFTLNVAPFNNTPYTSAFAVGSYSTTPVGVTPVPEPETYAMLAGLGLVGFGLYRRCRK